MSEKPYKRVVIGVAGTGSEHLAQQQAVATAACVKCSVLAIHVLQPGEAPAPDLWDYLQAQCARWQVPLQVRVIDGNPAEELNAEAAATDMVVIGTKRLGKKFHLGMVAEQVIRQSAGTVHVVRLDG